jgi:hypothetical protein
MKSVVAVVLLAASLTVAASTVGVAAPAHANVNIVVSNQR